MTLSNAYAFVAEPFYIECLCMGNNNTDHDFIVLASTECESNLYVLRTLRKMQEEAMRVRQDLRGKYVMLLGKTVSSK